MAAVGIRLGSADGGSPPGSQPGCGSPVFRSSVIAAGRARMPAGPLVRGAVGIQLGRADEGSPARGPTGVARRPHSGRAEMVGTHAHQGSGREKAEGCASKFDAGYYRRLLGKALAEVEFVLGLQCYGK